MVYRIEVSRKGIDPRVQGLAKLLSEEGLTTKGLSIIRVYFLKTNLLKGEVEKYARELFFDPVCEDISFGRSQPAGMRALEVWFNPGVSDPESVWILNHFKQSKIPITDVKCATRYLFPSSIPRAKLVRFSERNFFNPLIQHLAVRGEEPFPRHTGSRFKIERIKLAGLSDKELHTLSVKRDWHLNLEEMKVIRDHFSELGREPTLTELETLAQTWSEHCVHKTFNAAFEVDGKKFSNLIKDTIMIPSKKLGNEWCLSLFSDNAGVVEFTDEIALAFKVETHNHPSAIEPYGGAATGIGGVIRDVLGTGQGADPILNTDVFCFGPPGFPSRKLPKGVLHPRRVLEGVVSGVRDYGNRMGIPTASGMLFFDETYIANPLVFCGTLGIMPKTKVTKKVSTGDAILVIGARTGRDGIHGVTFASTALAGSSLAKHGSAVQIGNPIEEKLLRDFIVKARDASLIASITDCGGGGLSSAVGEMTKRYGCAVDLEKVPLKYAGLSHHEIWISESQERMVVFVHPDKLERFLELAGEIGVEATRIGEVTDDKTLNLSFKGKQVADLDMRFLHSGLPKRRFKLSAGTREAQPEKEIEVIPPRDLGHALLRLLGQISIASKEWIIRQYDHEVQGRTVLKPLLGRGSDAPSDATVIQPDLEKETGVVVSCGFAARYAYLDAYAAAAAAIDEAIRNIVVSGGVPDRIALLDNFCAGDVSEERILYDLVASCRACRDAISAYRTPFISGKDSLNNFYTSHKQGKIDIPTTLLISALSIVKDVGGIVSTDLKRPGSSIYLIGDTRAELGGSEYFRMHKKLGKIVPKVNMKKASQSYKRLARAISAGLVLAAHDLSDGGLGVAISEMCLGGDIGAKIHMGKIPGSQNIKRFDYLIFSESTSRILVEVSGKDSDAFEKMMKGSVFGRIAETTSEARLVFSDDGHRTVATASVDEIRAAWTQGLSRFLD
ncbi:phosphoribosylformylglycinamidine synthase subunit PurL [candidate division WOR-3 bacterium]|uniref:Phosphoribosylformylglycinamidine synthase subunit PurL n=1 Tax=candidate division WOR-3 bacterium TaxID=2052148 RepID=A0A9D5K9L1_UNCW3|nr:phosphoribosylformylglycinamidine synthase subunit PurL [candidate division WOR-3 bacterium]MBD3364129.1 phosphoribosylformylglycinamidine synthase subunit PurL [candidate division WOR-3 bacterium]